MLRLFDFLCHSATISNKLSGKPVSSLNGFTLPAAPPHLAVYQDWLAAGYHAGMAYLANETARAKRADPRLVFPAARCLLLVGLPYGNPQALDRSPAEPRAGRIASYAWGRDYHDVIPGRLQSVLETSLRVTIPGLQRHRAEFWNGITPSWLGLGWIGKNTS